MIAMEAPPALKVPIPNAKELEAMLAATPVVLFIPDQTEQKPLRILPDRKADWCAALRSGRWQQIFDSWHGPGMRRCAFAVLYDLVEPMWRRDGSDEELDVRTARWLGVTRETLSSIAILVVHWNDRERMTFDQIANTIERAF